MTFFEWRIHDRAPRIDRRTATRASTVALAVRVATPLILALLFPGLRAFVRAFTIPDRALFFLAIAGALLGADTLVKRGREMHALAVAALALSLNLVNTVLSLVTLEPLVSSALSAARGGTAVCAAGAAILCAHPALTRLILAAGGALYAAAVSISSLYCLWRLGDVRRQARRAAEAGYREAKTIAGISRGAGA